MTDPTALITELRELADRADEAASLAAATGVPDPDAVRTLGDELAALIERRRPQLDAGRRVRLEQLTVSARSDDPRKRPPARTFATRVRAATPTRRRPTAPRTAPAIAVAALVAIGTAITAAPTSSTIARPDSTPPASDPVPTGPATVTVDGVTYAVGSPGDVAIATTERCEPPRVAVLRPSTGAVYRFRDLAGPGEEIIGELVGTATDAVDLTPPPGCADLPTPIDPTGHAVPLVTVPIDANPLDTANQEPSS